MCVYLTSVIVSLAPFGVVARSVLFARRVYLTSAIVSLTPFGVLTRSGGPARLLDVRRCVLALSDNQGRWLTLIPPQFQNQENLRAST